MGFSFPASPSRGSHHPQPDALPSSKGGGGHGGSEWANVPMALLPVILSKAGAEGPPSCRLVCCQWRDGCDQAIASLKASRLPRSPGSSSYKGSCSSLIGRRLRNLVSLDISSCSSMTALDLLPAVRNLSCLRSLSLPRGISLTRRTLSPLQSVTGLTSLSLQEASFSTDGALSPLASCICLRTLDLRGLQASDAWLPSAIASLSSGLQELRIGPLLVASSLLGSLSVSQPQLQALDVSGCCDLSVETLEGLPASLRELTFSHAGELDRDFCAALGRLTGLTALSLSWCCWGAGAAEGLEASILRLVNLRHLDLSRCPDLGNNLATAIAHSPSGRKEEGGLESLSLEGCWHLTDSGVEALSSIPSLTALNIARCTKVTPEGLASLFDAAASCKRLAALQTSGLLGALWRRPRALPGLSSLARLSASSCGALRCLLGSSLPPPGALSPLASMGSLLELDLTCNRIPLDRMLKDAACHLSSLKVLCLSDSNGLGDAGVASLGLIPSLTRLDISHCAGASDCSLEALGALTALRHVSLLGCENFRGRCFGSWNRMTALKSVDVSRCLRLDNDGLYTLLRLPSITCLRADHPGPGVTPSGLSAALKALAPTLEALSLAHGSEVVTDVFLASVAAYGLRSLQDLRIPGCTSVTDPGVAAVGGCPSLTALDVSFCKQVTENALERVAARLPLLQRLHSKGCVVSVPFYKAWDGAESSSKEEPPYAAVPWLSLSPAPNSVTLHSHLR